jgi:uncharacterized membrane protein
MGKFLDFVLTPAGFVLLGIAVLVLLFVLAYASKMSFLILGYAVLIILVMLVVFMVFKITDPELIVRILERLTGKAKE